MKTEKLPLRQGLVYNNEMSRKAPRLENKNSDLKRRYRKWLLLLGAAGALFIYMIYVEPRWIEVTEKVVPVRGLTRPLRLVHLTDLHLSKYTGIDIIEKAVTLAMNERPDIICLTGDYVRRKLIDREGYRRQLARLAKVPTIAVFGNHDGGEWVAPKGGYPGTRELDALLTDAGIVTLKNENVTITIRGRPIRFVGTGDGWAGDLDPVRAFKDVSPTVTEPVIALVHNPDAKDQLPAGRWDLMLSGHTHGGQLRIPFTNIRPFLPVKDPRYAEGLFALGNGYLHVSRGIGGTFGARLNCRPEVSVLKLVPHRTKKMGDGKMKKQRPQW